MPHLLHIDSSILGDNSVSRRLTARPDGTVTYRDFGSDPLPHLDSAGGAAHMVPVDQHTPAQAESYALRKQLIDEIKAADVVLLGLPLYNFGAPSTVKAWVDHLIVPGLSMDAETRAPLLGGREFIAIASRGGGYAPGTPRDGWDHAGQWLPHGISLTGLEPHFIIAELTLANIVPEMAELKPMADASLAAAEQEIDGLWQPVAAAA
jgi:FMN-dependent NADH-azoreductase